MYFTALFRRIRRWITRSTQRRLIFSITIFWAVSLSGLCAIFLWVGQNQMLQTARQRNIQLASMISRDVSSEISGISLNTRAFVQHLEMLSPEPAVQAEAILGLRLSDQQYRAIYYFERGGNQIIHLDDTPSNLLALKSADDALSRPPVPLDEDVVTSFKAATSLKTYISDVTYAGLDYTPVFYIGMPVNFPSGEVRVIVFEIDLSGIWRNIDIASIGLTGITYVVSSEGTIIAHPEPAFVGRQVPQEVTPVLESYEGFAEYFDPYEQKDVIAAYSPVGGATGWGIVVEQQKAETYAAITQTGTIIIILWAMLGVAGIFSIFIITRSFTKPIKQLTRTVRGIAHTGALAKIGLEQRPDEVGQLSEAFDQMIERVDEAQREREEATTAERTRLARELHDAVSQTLFSASLIADVLPRLWERNPEEGRRRLEENRQLTRGALAEMRTLLYELRPAALLDINMRDLLRQLTDSVTGRSRIPVSLEINGECELSPEVKIAIYRICQETMNNVTKHSQAHKASIVMDCTADQVILKVTDDGHGFNLDATRPGSLGIGIMRERAGAVGAVLEISSQEDHGTQITVVWSRPQKKETENDTAH